MKMKRYSSSWHTHTHHFDGLYRYSYIIIIRSNLSIADDAYIQGISEIFNDDRRLLPGVIHECLFNIKSMKDLFHKFHMPYWRWSRALTVVI